MAEEITWVHLVVWGLSAVLGYGVTHLFWELVVKPLIGKRKKRKAEIYDLICETDIEQSELEKLLKLVKEDKIRTVKEAEQFIGIWDKPE